MADTLERIQAICRDVFDDAGLVVRPETTAVDVENWDSISHFNLIVATEREFNVKFTTADITSIESIGDLVSLVEKKASSS